MNFDAALAPVYDGERCSNRREFATQARDDGSFSDWESADGEHARLGTRDDKVLLFRLGHDASHDRRVRGVVAKQPESQGISQMLIVVLCTVPEASGKRSDSDGCRNGANE